jgi:ATP-dependent DNA helicase RecG
VARSLKSLADAPVSALQGVAGRRAEALAGVGIESVLDLVTHYPRRYVDRTKEARIADLREGEEALVVARVVRSATVGPPRGKQRVVVDVSDGTGRLRVTFFNQRWREQQLQPGAAAAFFGKLEVFRGTRQLTNPIVDLIGGDQTGRIVPLYPQSDKARVYSRELERLVAAALDRAGELADPVPDRVRRKHDLVDRTTAFRWIHAPTSMEQVGEARRRLVFDELFRVQVALVVRKRALQDGAVGVKHAVGGPLVQRFHEGLPFSLTAAQRRVIGEIDRDLGERWPMHRLLQGDVGSGKTVVAVTALLTAVDGGHQGALMVPTAVLAEQHFAGVRGLLDGCTVPDTSPSTLFGERPLRVELLTNRTTAAERRRLLAGLAAGEVDLLVGTHALIEEGVQFESLGVVVIDEQHRFGVEQRAALRDKGDGNVPDVLVMTATPIPRTAAMTVYGDLDVSVLDELPPGRTPITTRWARSAEHEAEAWDLVRREVAAGHQAYVVCPLVEDSEKLEAASAEATYERLVDGELAGLRLGLLHGRVPPAEKEATMGRFRAGGLDVLVATTVIEVGVDVPNATVMVVIDADRFGIAQLHQLRGRVGRGTARSWCWLVGAGATPEAEERLAALVRTTDGFELAEVDLDLRGEGTIMGERQAGRTDLKLASLRRDRLWVERAREVAIELVDADPTLATHPILRAEVAAVLGDDADFLLKS